jgi:hypothetical protein
MLGAQFGPEANIAASPAGAAGVALAADLRPSDKPLI